MIQSPWIPPVAAGATLAAATGGVALVSPLTRHIPTCFLYDNTGILCPACGCLRAVEHLVHGRIHDAWLNNQFFVAFVPVIALGWIFWFYLAITGRRFPRIPGWVIWAVFIAWIVFAIVRNLPGFEYLRPPK